MNKEVEKIRAEVKRRREIHRKAKRIESAFEDNAILCYIDSMQEEPKKCMYSKDDYTDEDRKVLCDGCEEECKYIKSDDFTKALAECISQAQVRVVDPLVLAETWKDELIKLAKSEEPVSEIWHNCDEKPKIGEVIIMYDTKYTYPECGYLVDERKFIFNNGSMDWEACNLEYERWAYFSDLRHKKEEPVSEDLEVIAREHAGIPCDAPKDLAYCVHDKKAKYDAVLFGANWQKQQIMAKAIYGTARPDDNEIWCNLASSNLKDGDIVRVIVIKED